MSDSQPIILDGGAKMITVTLPPSFKQKPAKGNEQTPAGSFSVSPMPETESFKTIVITDTATKIEVLIPIKARRWRIEIK